MSFAWKIIVKESVIWKNGQRACGIGQDLEKYCECYKSGSSLTYI